MSITKRPFGTLENGQETTLYTLTNATGASVSIINYGGIIQAIRVPDKDGKLDNVVLGYDDVAGYIPTNGYIGALIGRVGNRIGRGRFELNGEVFQLATNDGRNHLHGGMVGFNTKIWDATELEGICEDSLILKIVSPDGEENYPGTLRVMVTYTFTDANELIVHYEAVSDKDTLCNLTNHSYFNMAGQGSRSIEEQTLEINADTFTVTDDESIPTGEMRNVEGTPFDLREAVKLGDRLCDKSQWDEQMAFGKGFDHNFNLNDDGMRFAARMRDPESGRAMSVFTDQSGVQLYTANMLTESKVGSCGRSFHVHDALCLETQAAPDSINQPTFPEDTILRAGDKYDTYTIFAFDTDEE